MTCFIALWLSASDSSEHRVKFGRTLAVVLQTSAPICPSRHISPLALLSCTNLYSLWQISALAPRRSCPTPGQRCDTTSGGCLVYGEHNVMSGRSMRFHVAWHHIISLSVRITPCHWNCHAISCYVKLLTCHVVASKNDTWIGEKQIPVCFQQRLPKSPFRIRDCQVQGRRKNLLLRGHDSCPGPATSRDRGMIKPGSKIETFFAKPFL